MSGREADTEPFGSLYCPKGPRATPARTAYLNVMKGSSMLSGSLLVGGTPYMASGTSGKGSVSVTVDGCLLLAGHDDARPPTRCPPPGRRLDRLHREAT